MGERVMPKIKRMDYPNPIDDAKAAVRELDDVIMPFGSDDDKDEEARKQRMRRRGCMKANPLKIKYCLERMEELVTTEK